MGNRKKVHVANKNSVVSNSTALQMYNMTLSSTPSTYTIQSLLTTYFLQYIKKFAPVASNSTTRMIVALTLWHHEEGWTCKTVDIEATFLKGSIEELTYLEWPPGSVELGYPTVNDLQKQCI